MNRGRRHAGWAVALLGLLSMRVFAVETSQQQAADSKAYLAHVSDLFKKEWPANRTVNIVCHGHSVPAGYFRTPAVDSPNAYPHLLFMGLKERFPVAVINVIVTAIGGENSSLGAARFETDVLACKPDVVTIDYGLNDRGLGLERTRANLVSMIEKSQKQNVAVILLTPTADTGAKVDNPNDPLNQQAELIRSLSKEYRVALVDSLDLFQDAIKNGTKLDDLMSQGNHPNRKGHDLVAERLLDWFPQ